MCCAKYRNESYTGLFNSGYLLSGTCRHRSTVEWHWLKFLNPGHLEFRSVSFVQQTNLWQTVGELDSHHTLRYRWIDLLRYRWTDLQGMQSMVLTPANDQSGHGTSPVVVQFLFVVFHFVVCNCLYAKGIRSHSDIGKMIQCFCQDVSENVWFCPRNIV